MNMSIYTENGYDSRKHYLECLSEDYGVDKETVFALANMLGSNEDWDGLVTLLEDLQD